jgi:hypothetical protein
MYHQYLELSAASKTMHMLYWKAGRTLKKKSTNEKCLCDQIIFWISWRKQLITYSVKEALENLNEYFLQKN